jgi:SAM-dependent methyltransferase
MTTQSRWQRAQQYEQGFWEGVAQRAAEGSYDQIDFYAWRAGELLKKLAAVGATTLVEGRGRVLELGSGPVGVVGFLPGIEKVAVDPLNGYYATNARLTELRKPDVQYIEAPGERVPLEAGRYDLVIMENCIDHTQDPDAVMREIRRVLKADGLLYLTVNGRSRFGYWIHRALAGLSLDPGHPHTFTVRRFQNMLRRFGFDVLHFEAASWKDAWLEDLGSGQSRGRLKALLFVSEHLLSAVSRRVPDGASA